MVVIAKAIGFMAFFITCAGYLSRSDDKLKLAIAVSAGLLSFHYVLLAAWVAAASLLVNFVRNQISRKRQGISWFVGFAIIQLAVSVILYQTVRDIFPILGSLISGYALFCERGRRLRILMIICTIMWLINNILLLSYGAMLQDSLSIIANVIGIAKIAKVKGIGAAVDMK